MVDQLRRERDFYLGLLELTTREELAPFLEDALDLLTEISGAKAAWLALFDPQSESASEPAFHLSRGLTEEAIRDIQLRISSGIIAEAIATGEIVQTASALSDPRFNARQSVRRNRIQAVMCAPIGRGAPEGVVYLQDKTGGGVFGPDVVELVERFVRHLAPQVRRLLELQRRRGADDPTRPWRDKLHAGLLIGRSEAMAAVLRQAALVAPLDVSVLLTGPSGTGKTALARVIAMSGPRAAGPFVELNCAALPDNLLESELFGAERGAHSTATRRVAGKVEAAEGGTLFLDEVGALAPAAQGKLLQLLQSRSYYALGSTRPATADVRIIAATNEDLRVAVAERRFREDLLYRLEVLPIALPGLAERGDDIAELVQHFRAQTCERHGLPVVPVSAGFMRAAEHADWPGHIRQLAHAVEAAVIRCAGEAGSELLVRHLFPDREPGPSDDQEAPGGLTFQEATRRFQRELLSSTLEASGWNVTEAARRLDLARSHIYNLIRAFDLRREPGP